jgi:hypothetical protein
VDRGRLSFALPFVATAGVVGALLAGVGTAAAASGPALPGVLPALPLPVHMCANPSVVVAVPLPTCGL